MTITNGYATQAQLKAWLKSSGIPSSDFSSDTDDDDTMDLIIEAASRYIDNQAGRTFYADTADTVHYFDTPNNPIGQIIFDDDLLSLATTTDNVLNGDGEQISSTDYILLPANKMPKYAIQLKRGASKTWLRDTMGNELQAIQIKGKWGAASSAPTDITQACIAIAGSWYKNRYGQNLAGAATITAAGVVITAQDVPDSALAVINNNRRFGFG